MRWKSSTRRQSKANTTERMKRTKIVWWFSTPIQDLKGTPTPPSLPKTKAISNEMDKRMKQKYGETMTKTKKKGSARHSPPAEVHSHATDRPLFLYQYTGKIDTGSMDASNITMKLQWMSICNVLSSIDIVDGGRSWDERRVRRWCGREASHHQHPGLGWRVTQRMYRYQSTVCFPADVPVDVKMSLWTSWY